MTAPTIPDSSAGLHETLSNAATVKAIRDSIGMPEFLAQYTDQFAKADKGVTDEAIREMVQNELLNFYRDNGQDKLAEQRPNLTPGKGAPDLGARYNQAAPGAALDRAGIFNSTREYLRAIYHNNSNPDAVALRHKIRNDFSSVVPSDGGFLVPESLRSTLLETSLESSLIRPRATVIPMEAPRVALPVLDSTSNASTVFGGMVAYWTEEAAALVKSSAKFGRVVLDAKKLTGYSVVPNELFTDSIISMEAFLQQKWPQAIAWTEDLAHIAGTGVGEPLGVMGATAMVNVAAESGQSAATIVWENIIKMFARMLPTSLGSAVWIANIETFPELATMALSVGTGGGPVWLNSGVDGPPMSILGRPVYFTEKVPALGTAGDIAFVDLSYYLVGDLQTMQMATSEHIEFDTDQTAVRIIQRGDGRPWLNSAITPNKGSSTLSPFVRTATRS